MDYKELIRRLDNCGEFDGDLLDDAATAIETLLAERDAAVEEIETGCDNCKYLDVDTKEEPCASCDAKCSKWKWRDHPPPDCERKDR